RSAVKSLDRGERGERGGAQSEGAAATQRPASVLPRALRWMQGMLPLSAGTLGSMFGALVENHPDMRAFVAEVPQVGRVLRPLLRLAGLTPPAWLALPARVRRSDPPPHPSPSRGEGESGAAGIHPRRRRTA